MGITASLYTAGGTRENIRRKSVLVGWKACREQRPLELSFRLAIYILKKRLRGQKRFPLVTMLEPLEMCNLACIGCGRIREYKPVLDKMMSVEVAINAVKESGAPIVSIAGGEPTIHPRIDQIINGLIEQKYFVYCCTNGLLLERLLDKVKPSKYLCWVVHVDGMEQKHDESVDRPGVFKKAIQGINTALDRGYRVCTNSTVFRGSDVEDLWEMFRLVSDIGVEGSMISPGYDFADAPDQDMFLTRGESHALFRKLLDPEKNSRHEVLQQSLVPEFSKGCPRLPVYGLVQSNLYRHGLAKALLSTGRRARAASGGVIRRRTLGAVRCRERSAVC
jgi:hopanoid biosynthesis associated radical SAM protein HpnH